MLHQSDGRVSEDELVAIADQGANFIAYSSLTDPENEAQIERELGEAKSRKCIPYLALIQEFFFRLFKFLGLAK